MFVRVYAGINFGACHTYTESASHIYTHTHIHRVTQCRQSHWAQPWACMRAIKYLNSACGMPSHNSRLTPTSWPTVWLLLIFSTQSLVQRKLFHLCMYVCMYVHSWCICFLGSETVDLRVWCNGRYTLCIRVFTCLHAFICECVSVCTYRYMCSCLHVRPATYLLYVCKPCIYVHAFMYAYTLCAHILTEVWGYFCLDMYV
jgi:hypothetical protein